MAYEYRSSSVVDPDRKATGRRSLAQGLAFTFGLVFLLVGIAGFIPGITEPFEGLSFLGTDSEGELLHVFRVSVFHNIVHLLFGVGIIAAARHSWSLAYLIGGGIAYALVSLYGFVIDQDSDANFLPINTADNLLHAALALALVGAGLVALAASRRRPVRA